ncbi:hypothetical protein COV17_02530 [Candidatus Woesearchaeota archaeon CG10_big_fil_rev_8_21_14_0_10_36_11]|nr:MAG: hypothetical protein COV17_02530 [Candidatus Woesearchaeota archaeon CG10_big_fil_rev_8_21_14_0_10_36_11]
MSQFIVYQDKNVKAKGLTKNNIINETKLKDYFYESDYDNLHLLETIPPFELNVPVPTLFYPGCGVDILFPLHYINSLLSHKKEINFLFMDTENCLGMIKTILDEIGISFSAKKNAIDFYWNNTKVHLAFQIGNVFTHIDSLPLFHIYFERAFRIMRDEFPLYEEKIIEKLYSNGIVISDSGFQAQNLTVIEVPKILSSYHEMIIGIKALKR